MAADASIRVAVGRVALERRKARYPQTRHHGCFLRVIGAHRAIAEALLSAPHPDRDLARCVLGQLLFVGRAVEDTMQCMLDSDGGCDRGGDAVSSVNFRTWNDLETRHALDKILSRQALSSRLHSEEQRGWVAACDGHDSCGRKLLNSVLSVESRDHWAASGNGMPGTCVAPNARHNCAGHRGILFPVFLAAGPVFR